MSEPRDLPSGEPFCICTAKLIFVDTGPHAYYQCPVCLATYKVSGAATKLYEFTVGKAGHLFNPLIMSSANDPCNKKIQQECPKCLREIQTFLLVGDEGKPFITCSCGNIMQIDHSAKG